MWEHNDSVGNVAMSIKIISPPPKKKTERKTHLICLSSFNY